MIFIYGKISSNLTANALNENDTFFIHSSVSMTIVCAFLVCQQYHSPYFKNF